MRSVSHFTIDRVTFSVFIGVLGAAQTRRVAPSENLLDKLPLKPKRIRRRTVVSHASALLDSTFQQRCTWAWRTGHHKQMVGEGSNAEIIEVNRKDEIDDFVVKIAKPDASTEEIDDEVKIMLAASRCPSIAQPEDPKPCLNGEKINTGAYVMRRFRESLHEWLVENRAYARGCAADVASQVAKGLNCLHQTAGYIHGDLKADNILIDRLDHTTMCPKAVFIADLGLSKPIGIPVRKYHSTYYNESNHLPDSVFSGHRDTLGIQSTKPTDLLFVAHPSIDWCSFTYMMKRDFSYSWATSFGFEGDCGMMGPKRNTHVVAIFAPGVAQTATTVEELPFCDYGVSETVKVRSSIASHVGGFVPGFVIGIASTNLTVDYGREVYGKRLSLDSKDLRIYGFPPKLGDLVGVRSSIVDFNFVEGYVTEMDKRNNVDVLYADQWYQKTLDRCSDDLVPWE